jgi:hypothetical protein
MAICFKKSLFLPAVIFFLLAGPRGVWADWALLGGTVGSIPLWDIESGSCGIAYYQNTPYVVYKASLGDLYVKYFNGTAWAPLGGCLNVQYAVQPDIALDSSGVPYVAWQEEDVALNDQITVKYYNGSSWQPLGGSLNNTPTAVGSGARMAFVGTVPYVVFMEAPNHYYSGGGIYVKKWTGSQWDAVGDSLNVSSEGYTASIAVSAGGTPYVAWSEDAPSGATCVYVKNWDGAHWNLLGGGLNLDQTQKAVEPSIGISASGVPFVVWRESVPYIPFNPTGNGSRLRVKKFNGLSWDLLSGSITVGYWGYTRLPRIALYQETPYVSWNEGDAGIWGDDISYVQTYTSGSWHLLGSPLNVNGTYDAISPVISISESGIPSVVWAETMETKNFGTNYYVKSYFSPTPTPSQTITATPIPSATFTETSTLSPTPSITSTRTESPTLTPTPSSTATLTSSPSVSVTPTDTKTATLTLTFTITDTPTTTPTPTISATVTCTPPITMTPTQTVTGTIANRIIDLQGKKVLIYPNPGKTKVALVFQAEGVGNIKVQIYNISGERVAILSVTANTGHVTSLTWDCSLIAPGIYLARVLQESQEIGTVKFALIR